MIDREKVINGLEWILNDIKENGHYQVDNYEDDIREALALLKEQEPRVLTLEEVLRMDRDYYYLEELRIKDKATAMYLDIYRLSCVTWPSITGCRQTAGDDKYNRVWRCWTERPTDEQRKAVKWDD